ncbi:MAG: ATP-NAD kinase family protein [Candidatus Thermoplasmatota archaeon]|nr:ATP-NAD kinase family protein [Candidatus Thermoplasmatota archaeon]MBU1941497.1 ATP-NAD kinase family protein [Candidatus Thermoplasmatota archaeon]
MKKYHIGLIVNPIAGMGGKVGLKGTDGVVDQAKKLGATPVAADRTNAMLKKFQSFQSSTTPIHWYTCEGLMGHDALVAVGFTTDTIVYASRSSETSALDTKKACESLVKNDLDLLLFCGGDGTARDILKAIDKRVPILGIPSGVKMHSAVFGITTAATAKMLAEFIQGRLTIGDVEIMDLDEERYRKGEWNIRLYGIAKGIIEPTYVQVGKATYESISDNTIKDELAEHITDTMKDNPETLFLFGSGGTIDYIAEKLYLSNTLLGIDAIYQNKTIATDLNEQQLLTLIKKYPNVKLVLSPIGAQGFILGRGNLQLSSQVIKKIGIDNLIIISTPAKLLHTPIIRVDSGDPQLDKAFTKHEFFMVVIGYRLSRVVKIQTNNF